ncbi:major facilitator superfamily domain-containing protein [Scheffersomyces amazonensis]|uniref:major facilitator superfamily domain-containing protein n=1 Tax=Scheffersomyces amazonensis TaxID=1078765 RepID=UPI00315D6AFA
MTQSKNQTSKLQDSLPHHHELHPNIIKDSSAGGAGIIAAELAAEEEGLISNAQLKSHSYGAIAKSSSEETTTTEIDDHDGYALPKAQLLTVISSLFMASYLAALDMTVVTTLLTLIASDLKEVSNISWIATAYLLSCAAFQPLFGKLSDIFGRKILLILCSGFFAIGCVICVTDSLFWLVIGRFVTGIGGSGLTALGTITMSDLIPLRDRGFYQGLANVFFGLGSASGGMIGGLIADSLGWKYVFILQVPLALIVGISLYLNLNLPEGSPGLGAHGVDIKQKLKRVDFLGSFFLVSSLMLILTAASLGGKEIPYNSKTFIGLTSSSFILLALFVYAESYISEEPIIPIHLLGNRTILASSLANWFYTMGVFTYLFYIPVYYTAVMQFSATQNGLRLVPNFFGVSLGSVGAGLYMRKTGKYYNFTVIVGLISVLGVIRILCITPQIPLWEQFVLLLPSGIGYSSILTVTLLSLIAAVPSKYQACTTSIQYTFRSTGSTLGVAIASAIFQNVLRSNLYVKIYELVADKQEANEIIAKALENADYAKSAPKLIKNAIIGSYSAGCKGAFWFSVLAIVLGYTSSLFMREHKLHTSINRD